MRTRVLLVALTLLAAGCKKPRPPPEPLEPIDSPPVTLQSGSGGEGQPLVVAHVTAADLHVNDAGATLDAGVDAGPLPTDAGPDAGDDDDAEEPDAGSPVRTCPADGGTFFCTPSCWCHAAELATISNLKGLATVGDKLWAVGDRAMLRGDGKRWGETFDPQAAKLELPGVSKLDPQPSELTAVAGGGTDVWAANGNDLLHFDGRSWNDWDLSRHGSLNPVAAMSATARDDLWAVGRGGLIAHGDGQTWEVQASGTTEQLYGVSAASRDDVWAVGTNATVLHDDGNGWKPVDAPVPKDRALFGVWARDGEVWIVGEKGTLLHRKGNWLERVPAGTDYGLFSVVRVHDDVIAVGQLGVIVRSEKGGPFRVEGTDVILNLRSAAVHGGRVWAVGDNGAMVWKDL
ncbi:MAG: hypothetical protein JST54_13565 [Deltaproteobacteria bacterium]|nr:hypothetical protein [Deltaproteobacteria bacterium]